MTEAEITAAIRRGIRDYSGRLVSDSDISDVITRGIKILGLEVKEIAPDWFNKRVSVSSDTHVFSFPSDCLTVLRVWDLKTNAKSVTGATNASPIVITSAAHGFSDDEIVVVHDVGGNTAANGTWKVASSATNTFELYGSTGNAAYTSGGKIFELKSTIKQIRRINLEESTFTNKAAWFPQERNIVVDHPDFTYDIMVDYIASIDETTDIPAEYHDFLISFGIIDLLEIPPPTDPDYNILTTTLNLHIQRLEKIRADINRTLKSSVEPKHIPEEFDFEDFMVL